MTAEMQLALQRELEDAKEPVDVSRAQSHCMIALMDCQRKTADRVKTIIAKDEADCNQKKGAKWAFGVVVSIVSVVGQVVAIKICKVIGILW